MRSVGNLKGIQRPMGKLTFFLSLISYQDWSTKTNPSLGWWTMQTSFYSTENFPFVTTCFQQTYVKGRNCSYTARCQHDLNIRKIKSKACVFHKLSIWRHRNKILIGWKDSVNVGHCCKATMTIFSKSPSHC